MLNPSASTDSATAKWRFGRGTCRTPVGRLGISGVVCEEMQRLEAVRGVPGGLHLLSVRFTYLVLTIPTQPVTLCTGAASRALPGVAGTFDRPLPTCK